MFDKKLAPGRIAGIKDLFAGKLNFQTERDFLCLVGYAERRTWMPSTVVR
jgi:hypothetical protein